MLDGGFNEAAIVAQVTNGKSAMPTFAKRLEEKDIEDVAAFVYNTAAEEKWQENV